MEKEKTNEKKPVSTSNEAIATQEHIQEAIAGLIWSAQLKPQLIKANVSPVGKKGEHNPMDNNRLASLGEEQEVIPFKPEGSEFTLSEMHNAVGGYIELVHLNKINLIMIIDEEGKLKHKNINTLATIIMKVASGGHAQDDYICGDAIITTSKYLS